LESAEFFNPGDYNQVFNGQLEKLIHRLPDGEAKQQAMAMKGFDFGGYISRSLLRAGFRDDDQQEHFHAIAVRLLVEPGKLFKGGSRKGMAGCWSDSREALGTPSGTSQRRTGIAGSG